jgi:hypothetical protein
MKTLKDGLYRTTQDVKMPHPDRRVTREWQKMPVIPAGTEFIVRTDVVGQNMGVREDRFWGIHSVRTDNREYSDLVDALQPLEEETLDAVLDRSDLKCRDLLDRLLEDGFITVKALDRLAQDIRAKDLAERSERVRQHEEEYRKATEQH